MFRHYLITRFNIVQAWYGQYTTVSGIKIQSDEWLAERFRLFDLYCFPSIAQQTTQDFVWLVLFNSETDERYRRRIAEYAKQCPAFTPLYLEPYGDENALVRGYILDHTPKEQYTHIITTRCDNDDVLRRDYLQMVQQAFSPETKDLFVNYRYGYQYDTRTKVSYPMDYPSSHYISRVEALTPDIQTVLCDHSELDKLQNYKELANVNGGGWIEIITGINAANRLMYGARPQYIPHLEQFLPRVATGWGQTHCPYLLFCLRSARCYCRYWKRWAKHKFEKHILKRIYRSPLKRIS